MAAPDFPALRDTPPPRDFLASCLRQWPASHALLRAIECRKLWRYPLTAPTLDVGCGDGILSGFLFPAPLESGIDLNLREVRRAARNQAHRSVLAASATHLPYSDRAFGSVFSNCVLEHIDNLDLALQEINRVLRPQGMLLTTVPTPRWESEGPLPQLRRLGLHGISDRLNRILRRLWHHVTVEEEDAWRRRLARARLKLLVWEPYMVPAAYAAYARYLPCSVFSFILRRLIGRWLLSKTLRRMAVPLLARLLRRAYEAEDSAGACALVLAVKED
jgi:SAM-dependent methyltransferase